MLVSSIARIGERAARIARVIVPDPYVIAILLGVVTIAAGAVVSDDKPLRALIVSYGTGFLQPDLLAFAFQMVLVLLTGNAIAAAPVVARGIRRLADVPSSGRGAAALVAFVAMVLALFNWGLGLIGGAILAREVGRSFRRRGLTLHYGVVGAAGFLGIAVWHGGLSGSAPLKVASDGPFGPAIPVTDTLFSPLNLVVSGALVVALTAFFWALGAARADADLPSPPAPSPDDAAAPAEPAAVGLERLERSRVVLALLALPLAFAVVSVLYAKGAAGVTLDWVILLFLVVGLALHGTPRRYGAAFADGAREAAGIVLQFPLYFGIIAVARDSGLVAAIARAFADVTAALPLAPSTAASFVTFWSACVVNFFVPSGGGQWAVQSPVILELSKSLAVDRAPLVVAFAFGDQTTNLLQVFWALPLLSLTGLRARDVLGFTSVAMLLQAAIVMLGLALFTPP